MFYEMVIKYLWIDNSVVESVQIDPKNYTKKTISPGTIIISDMESGAYKSVE